MEHKEDWEESFDKEFTDFWTPKNARHMSYLLIDRIKNFISTLLARKEAEKEALVREIVDKLPKENIGQHYAHSCSECLHRIHCNERNKAIDDAITAIKELATKHKIK